MNPGSNPDTDPDPQHWQEGQSGNIVQAETGAERLTGKNSECQIGGGRNRKEQRGHRGNMSRQDLGMSDRRRQELDGAGRPQRKHIPAGTRKVRQEQARIGRSREITKQTYHDIQVETRKIGQEQVGIAGARRPQAGIGNRREDTVETHPCGQE